MEHIYRTAYGPRTKSTIEFEKTGRTKQAHKDETDINLIMAKYVKTGVLEHANKHAGSYGFASSADFKESLEIIQTAQEMFDELPSQIRTKFENNPADFLDFVQDPANATEMYELGLSDINPNITLPVGTEVSSVPTGGNPGPQPAQPPAPQPAQPAA